MLLYFASAAFVAIDVVLARLDRARRVIVLDLTPLASKERR
jgi:hypothetical protein